MLDVAVISDPSTAEVSLDPVRARLLAELTRPNSAAGLAEGVGLARQKVNYHLRALERQGLVRLVEERRKGNCTERIMQASAAAYVISPAALGPIAPDTGTSPDRLSAQWLLALAGELIRNVGDLLQGGQAAHQRVATFAADTEIRFATPADRAAFTDELMAGVAGLVAKYHDGSAPRGRRHRLVVAMHPSVARPERRKDSA